MPVGGRPSAWTVSSRLRIHGCPAADAETVFRGWRECPARPSRSIRSQNGGGEFRAGPLEPETGPQPRGRRRRSEIRPLSRTTWRTRGVNLGGRQTWRPCAGEATAVERLRKGGSASCSFRHPEPSRDPVSAVLGLQAVRAPNRPCGQFASLSAACRTSVPTRRAISFLVDGTLHVDDACNNLDHGAPGRSSCGSSQCVIGKSAMMYAGSDGRFGSRQFGGADLDLFFSPPRPLSPRQGAGSSATPTCSGDGLDCVAQDVFLADAPLRRGVKTSPCSRCDGSARRAPPAPAAAAGRVPVAHRAE